MNIFAAVICVALGVALSETYAFIRRRAERAAYERGRAQAKSEVGIRDGAIDQYAVTVPRRLTDWQISNMQPGVDIPPYNYDLAQVPRKPVQVSQPFVDHMQANGQATVWLNKKEGQV